MNQKTLYRVLELLCVAALIAFIVALFLTRSGGTDKDLGDVSAPTISQLPDGMEALSNAEAAKTFGLDLDKVESLAAFEDPDIMDVSELLLVKLNDEKDMPACREAVEKHIADQKNLYKSYAPEQYALLSDSVLETRGNLLFYATAQNADALYDAFRNAL